MANRIGFDDIEHSDKRVCDDCVGEIDAGDQIAVYFTSKFWFRGDEIPLPSVKPIEFYCLDCYPNEIPVPHLGSNEGFYLAEVDKDNAGPYKFKELGLLSGSSKNSGYQWNPSNIASSFIPIPEEDYKYRITPMHVFSLFRKSGIDLRGFIKEETFEIPNHLEEQMKRIMELSRYKHHQESNPLAVDMD